MSQPKNADIWLRVRNEDDDKSCPVCWMGQGRWFTVQAVPGATPEANRDDGRPTGNIVVTLDCRVHPSGTAHFLLSEAVAELLAEDLTRAVENLAVLQGRWRARDARPAPAGRRGDRSR